MGKYKTLQLKTETHSLLQEYCNENGFKMSALVDKLIRDRITPSKNILKVRT